MSRFLCVMAPILQRLVALTVRVLLGLFLLSKMSLVVAYYLSHVAKVLFIVLGWILLRILFEDLDDLPATTDVISNM